MIGVDENMLAAGRAPIAAPYHAVMPREIAELRKSERRHDERTCSPGGRQSDVGLLMPLPQPDADEQKFAEGKIKMPFQTRRNPGRFAISKQSLSGTMRALSEL